MLGSWCVSLINALRYMLAGYSKGIIDPATACSRCWSAWEFWLGALSVRLD